MRLEKRYPAELWEVVTPASPHLLSWGREVLECSAAAALLLSRLSRVRLCDLIDSSPPGSAVLGILQTRTLEWVTISFSIWNALAFLFPTPQMSLPLPVPNYGLSKCRALGLPPALHLAVEGTLLQIFCKGRRSSVLGHDVEKMLGIRMWGSLDKPAAQQGA